MFSPKKLVLPGVLVGLMSWSALAIAQSPGAQEPPAGSTVAKVSDVLTFDALMQMLRGLGYEPTIQTSDNGSKSCIIKVEQDGWTFQFSVGLSGDQSVIWISSSLGQIPPGNKILPEAMLKLLQLNISVGKAKFLVNNGYLCIYMPVDNRGVTPAALRATIGILAGTVKSTAAAWNTGTWTAEGKDAAAFKAKIDGQNRKLQEAFTEFVQALKPIFQGGSVDRDQLKKAHAKMLRTLDEVRTSVKAIEVPNTPAARELVEVYQRLCDVYESMFTTELVEVIRIIEDEKIGASDRVAKITALLQQLAKREEAATKAIAMAQEKFRKEYGNV